MRPYVIINGVNSNTITGLIITKLPPITKPQMRLLTEQIDGRDGDINTPLGFSAYDKPLEIGLTAEADVNEVIAYFNQAGKIIFSNEPDKYYNFAIYDAIDFEKLIRFKTATINLHTQPYKYSNTQGAIALNSGSNTVVNSGNTVSKPDLILEGSGVVNLSINNRQIIEADLTDVNKILIDSDTMNAYEVNIINPIKSIKSNITPVQDLHGYSKPWSGGGGKNKYCDIFSQYTQPNDYHIFPIKLTQGQTYKLWASLKGSAVSGIVVAIVKDGTQYSNFVGFTPLISSNGSINTVPSFTVDGTYTNPKLVIYASTETVFNSIFANYNVQLEVGSTATAYEPYSNICPISGFNALSVTRTGKNLLNYDAWKTSSIFNGTAVWENNGVTLTATSNDCFTAISIPVNARIPVTEGETITLSWEETTNKSGNVFIFPNGRTTGMVSTNNASHKKLSYTATSGITFVTFRFGVADSGDTIAYKNIQIELGNQASDYTPYNGQTATVNFGQTVYGGVADVTNGKVNKTHGIVDLGSLTWVLITMGGNRKGFRASLPLMKTVSSSATAFNAICSNYATLSGNAVYSGSIGISAWGTNATDIGIYDSTKESMSVSDFKTAMSGVQLVYELATPIEITTTPENLTALSGQNNVYADTNGDTTVKVEIDGEEQTLTGEIVTFYIDELEYELGSFANRIVTGNYDNIKLEVGSNNVELTGAFTGGQLTRYSRWL